MSSTAPARPGTPTSPAGRPALVTSWLPEVSGDDPAALIRLAAGPPRRLGELVTDVNPAREPEVTQALQAALKSGRKVGEALVERGVITPAERDMMLEFQRHQRHEAPTEDRLRLGRILVSQGHITEAQLREALECQRRSGRPLGEELLTEGHISPDVLRVALGTQRRLVIASLVAALTMASPGAIPPAEAAKSVSQSIDFRITIPPVMRLQVLRQIETFEVTQQDVARGYVEVASASLLQVTANTAWEVSFLPRGAIARSARITGFTGDIVIGPEGGTPARLRPMSKPTMFDLSYRFDLAPDVRPGTYPWPLMVSAHAA